MTTQLNPTTEEKRKVDVQYRGGGSDAVYGIGLIGAWVYYISLRTSCQDGETVYVKDVFWTAFLVYALF